MGNKQRAKLVREVFSVPSETDEEFEALAFKFGMAKSQLLSMACRLGLNQILRTTEPQNHIPQSVWDNLTQQQLDPKLIASVLAQMLGKEQDPASLVAAFLKSGDQNGSG